MLKYVMARRKSFSLGCVWFEDPLKDNCSRLFPLHPHVLVFYIYSLFEHNDSLR